jgi:phosphopantothenoylcysteine decarboxylase
MSRIVLGVTGSVAAIRAPHLFEALRARGDFVRVVATGPSLYFFDPGEIRDSRTDHDWPSDLPNSWVLRDADEWPGDRYRRGDPVLHIALRDWADVLVVAPLDAHTLGKFALGLSGNALSCLFRAWDFTKPVILAPAMNTRMWDSPVTRRHLRLVLEDRGDGLHPAQIDLDEAPALFARHCPEIVLVPPQSKRLACGDVGMGAMAEVIDIAEAVRQWGEETPES